MEAVAEGAWNAGGFTIGILPGTDAQEANKYLSVALPTGLGIARNVLVVRGAQAVIAVGGGYGTLSEIALALKMGTPVIGLHSWEIPGIIKVCSPAEAIEAIRRCLGWSQS